MFELTVASLYGLLAFVAKRHITNLGPADLIFFRLFVAQLLAVVAVVTIHCWIAWSIAFLDGLLPFAILYRVGDTDHMRGTQNWLLVEVLGRGATETGVVIDRLVGATDIGPRVVVVIGRYQVLGSYLRSSSRPQPIKGRAYRSPRLWQSHTKLETWRDMD